MPATIGKLRLRSFDRATRRMIRAGADLKPAFRKVRSAYRKDQASHMKQQVESDGAPFQKLAASTRDKRISRGGRAGKFTKRGKLRKPERRKLNRVLSRRFVVGAKIKIERRVMRFTSPVKWAGVHLRGGIAGKGSRIPKREFLWVSKPFMAQLVVAITEHLRAAWENRKV